MTNIEEIWSVITDYPRYSVSTKGNVKRNDTGRILKPYIGNTGYYYIDLAQDGKRQNKTVHRLVAQAFLPNPENKPCINHINSVKADSFLENLEWCTYSENGLHSIKAGTTVRVKGIKNHICKFDEIQVRTIRSIENDFSFRKIAKYFKTSHGVISRIVSREGYFDVK